MPERNASVAELQRESERSRAALAATVTQLREKLGDTSTELKSRLSPGYIKQEIKDYVREERASLTENLRQKAKDNPLQAVAVGAAIAYPALGLLRAVPLPLMLIGAGLFFTSRRGQQTARDAKGKFNDAVQQGSDTISELAGTGRSSVDTGSATVVNKARAAMHDARDAIGTAAAGVAASAEAGMAQASALTGSAAQGLSNTQTAAANFLKDNALLAAGIGAAIGAFIAASLPASEAENKLFGADSDKLKAKARDAAAQGMDLATDYAAQAAGAVATAAARQGLDSSGVRDAVNTVTDGVRAVANRGLQAATGAETPANDTMSQRNGQ